MRVVIPCLLLTCALGVILLLLAPGPLVQVISPPGLQVEHDWTFQPPGGLTGLIQFWDPKEETRFSVLWVAGHGFRLPVRAWLFVAMILALVGTLLVLYWRRFGRDFAAKRKKNL